MGTYFRRLFKYGKRKSSFGLQSCSDWTTLKKKQRILLDNTLITFSYNPFSFTKREMEENSQISGFLNWVSYHIPVISAPGIQGQPHLCSKLQANCGYMRPCLEKENPKRKISDVSLYRCNVIYISNTFFSWRKLKNRICFFCLINTNYFTLFNLLNLNFMLCIHKAVYISKIVPHNMGYGNTHKMPINLSMQRNSSGY